MTKEGIKNAQFWVGLAWVVALTALGAEEYIISGVFIAAGLLGLIVLKKGEEVSNDTQ